MNGKRGQIPSTAESEQAAISQSVGGLRRKKTEPYFLNRLKNIKVWSTVRGY